MISRNSKSKEKKQQEIRRAETESAASEKGSPDAVGAGLKTGRLERGART